MFPFIVQTGGIRVWGGAVRFREAALRVRALKGKDYQPLIMPPPPSARGPTHTALVVMINQLLETCVKQRDT